MIHKPNTFELVALAVSLALIFSVTMAGRYVAPATLDVIAHNVTLAERMAHP